MRGKGPHGIHEMHPRVRGNTNMAHKDTRANQRVAFIIAGVYGEGYIVEYPDPSDEAAWALRVEADGFDEHRNEGGELWVQDTEVVDHRK